MRKPHIAHRILGPAGRDVHRWDVSMRSKGGAREHVGRYSSEDEAFAAMIHYCAIGEKLPAKYRVIPSDGKRSFRIYRRVYKNRESYIVSGRLTMPNGRIEPTVYVGSYDDREQAKTAGEHWKATGEKTKGRTKSDRPKKAPTPRLRVYKPRKKAAKPAIPEPTRPVCVPREQKASVDRIAMMKAILGRIG
jgi:hypothetical protein